MTDKTDEVSFERIPDSIDFCKEEEQILTLWNKLDAFKTCLKQSKNRPKYSFYDGPPFATGLPHYGHILAGTIKDIITRYAHQQGFHVERRFGWDCHGLPIEFEIDKALGINSPDDIEAMGIGKYNAECRKIVSRFASEWETIIGRMGRWIDFKNDYKTLYPWYMESIWWVFKQLFTKGLVYQGVKVMPFSTACSTPLSNFESGQNYKDTVDPAVVVSFPILDDPQRTSLIAWTTTPWTLPSNLALCVNPTMTYVRVKDLKTGNIYIMMEARLTELFKNESDYEILEKMLGAKLKDLKYKPLFNYFESHREKGAFRVLTDDYVTADTGTGVVHQAPYFGEDDFRICLAAGIITRDQVPVCPVDGAGKFTAPVEDFKGLHVKVADASIIKRLKADNRLVQQGQVKHSYPFCWRSDTPLIYKAVPSWFVRVEQISDRLLKNSSSTYWVPEFVRDKRFGNWLKEARDWAISRNRYWGTPIPLWISPDGSEIQCIGSIKELEELTGKTITDLHRESIDDIIIPSKIPGNPGLKRISEVFDCWFESGSMPYAQNHYPFENEKEFEDNFPADFIAEGIDQTRGWFYTLIVLSTALFDKPPFKNLIANGLVLASDGQKMSKRKKNYPDPLDIVTKYGADALRLYLINSPVVRAENLRFKEDGVRDIVKDVFLPWFNAFRFLTQNIDVFVQNTKETFYYDEKNIAHVTNTMDIWILSAVQSLLEFVKQEMKLYHLYTVVPRLTKFIDHLTNWYVRMNRKRFKGENGVDDTRIALTVLFNVLLLMSKIMAPFTPFLTEFMYQHLKKMIKGQTADTESIHYLMLPEPNASFFDKQIERAVSRMQSVIELGRILRDKKTMPIKYPLPEIVIIHHDEEYLKDIQSLSSFITSELNIKDLVVSMDKKKYGVSLRAEPDHKTLGFRLKNDFKSIMQQIKSLTDKQIMEFMSKGQYQIGNHLVEFSEIRVIYTTDKTADAAKHSYECESDNNVLILIDMNPDQAMQEEGVAREIINRIQKLRKKACLVPTDEIKVYYTASGDLDRIAKEQKSFIENTIKADFLPCLNNVDKSNVVIEEKQMLKDNEFKLIITSDKTKLKSSGQTGNMSNIVVFLTEKHGRFDKSTSNYTVIIVDDMKKYSYKNLVADVTDYFGLFGCKFDLRHENAIINEKFDIKKLANNNIYLTIN